MSDAFWTAAGLVVVALIGAFNVWQSSRIHKAVNSTATILADEKKKDQARIVDLESTIAGLRAEASATQQAAAIREAINTTPPARP